MEALVQNLYTPVLHYVRKRINSQEDAEDLTQEVFLKLSKSDNEKITNVKSWVYTIAKNTITDYYRKKKVYTEEVDDRPEPEERDDNRVVEQLSKWMSVFIERLPEDYREVMRLSELEGVSQKEIAETLNMNYVTVRSKIQRGRKKLRDVFTECCTISQGAAGSILSYERNKQKECDPECMDKEENAC